MIPEDELPRMWKEGGIPGLRLLRGHHPQDNQLINCFGRAFIAISHVWSHGLVNPKASELPSCQVRFLSKLVEDLSGKEGILWIDTLCVPIEEESKRIAISKLRSVYSGASKVLLIVKNLMQVGSDPTEQMMQLLASEWQRRLWTLQEGRLASELLVQFKEDCASVLDHVAFRPPGHISEKSEDAFDFYQSLKQDIKARFTLHPDVRKRWEEIVEDLALRSVTVKTDEPICLATLLGLSVEDSSPYPTMVDIYKSRLNHIPQDVMFLNQPRLQVPGLTWAPSTFLETEFVAFWVGKVGSPPGRLAHDGFLVVKDALVLDENLEFRRVPSKPSEVYIINTPGGRSFGLKAHNVISPEGQPVRIEHSRRIERPAIIWERPLGHFAAKGTSGRTSKGALVSLQFDRDGVAYCMFEMSFNGWSIRMSMQNFTREWCICLAELSGESLQRLKTGKRFVLGDCGSTS